MKVCPRCSTETSDSTRFCPNCGEPIPTQELAKDNLIGKVIAGRFLVLERIGQGAMGCIYKAEQTALGKKVCLKVLHEYLSGEESFPKRFHREARAASRLKHPNAINIIDFGTTEDGKHYIAMDFIDGQNLAELLRKEHPLDPLRILHIVDQICSALDEAHAQGIIHRDLKPQNIMVENRRHDSDFVTVVDFGIAKIKDPETGATTLTQAGSVLGTAEYMSPEQAKGEVLDARSDIYSLGVIMYQLCTGKLPFTADTPIGVVTKHLTEAPTPPREVNPAVHPAMEKLILTLMAKDKDKRPVSCNEVKKALAEIRRIVQADPDRQGQTVLTSSPRLYEVCQPPTDQQPSMGPRTSPYAPTTQALAQNQDRSESLGLGRGASKRKIAAALLLLVALVGGAYVGYQRFFGSSWNEEVSTGRTENPTGAGETAASPATRAPSRDTNPDQEAGLSNQTAAVEPHATKALELDRRTGELSGAVQKQFLSYVENEKLLSMRAEEWRARKREDKASELANTVTEYRDGMERLASIDALLNGKKLDEATAALKQEMDRSAVLEAKARILLAEKLLPLEEPMVAYAKAAEWKNHLLSKAKASLSEKLGPAFEELRSEEIHEKKPLDKENTKEEKRRPVKERKRGKKDEKKGKDEKAKEPREVPRIVSDTPGPHQMTPYSGFDRETVRRVISRHISDIRDCYRKACHKKPDLEGKVTVSLIISPTGSVMSANVVSSTLGDEDLHRCIEQKIMTWRFPAPPGGGAVKVNYPFVFRQR